MAKPESTKKPALLSMVFISLCFPWAMTMSQAKISTTTVRMAVPRLDSTSRMPTLTKMEVKLAKTAKTGHRVSNVPAFFPQNRSP